MNDYQATPADKEVYEVDPKRLKYGIYEHPAERMSVEGDIRGSYSADIIATDNKVRKPFQWRGDLMVVVGTTRSGGVEQADAYRLTPLSLFNGTPTTYLDKTGTEDGAEAARNDARGFYHAMTVSLGTSKFVLTGPPVRFIGARLCEQMAAESSTGSTQLGLF
jgi:hypothetical protein